MRRVDSMQEATGRSRAGCRGQDPADGAHSGPAALGDDTSVVSKLSPLYRPSCRHLPLGPTRRRGPKGAPAYTVHGHAGFRAPLPGGRAGPFLALASVIILSSCQVILNSCSENDSPLSCKYVKSHGLPTRRGVRGPTARGAGGLGAGGLGGGTRAPASAPRPAAAPPGAREGPGERGQTGRGDGTLDREDQGRGREMGSAPQGRRGG